MFYIYIAFLYLIGIFHWNVYPDVLVDALKNLQNSMYVLTREIQPPGAPDSELNRWIAQCRKLPTYKQIKRGELEKKTALTYDGFKKTIQECTQFRQDALNRSSELWVNHTEYQNAVSMKREDKDYPNFIPYAQKFAVQPGDTLIMQGDRHGDIHSFVAFLEHMKNENIIDGTFTIIKPNTYFIFLGDYVDRGMHSAEVANTIMRLQMANPKNCIFVRGNHETKEISKTYGCEDEFLRKFGEKQGEELFELVCQWYETLPVVLFVPQNTTREFIQCCHGGLEFGYIPDRILKYNRDETITYEHMTTFNRLTNYQEMTSSEDEKIKKIMDDYLSSKLFKNGPLTSQNLGFLWSDFYVESKYETEKFDIEAKAKREGMSPADIVAEMKSWKSSFDTQAMYGFYDKGRGWNFGWYTTLLWRIFIMNKCAYSLAGIFRAHQHGDKAMMHRMRTGATPGVVLLWQNDNKNIYNTKKRLLWDGVVATFDIAPGTYNGVLFDINFDTYGQLTVGAGGFAETWTFDIFNKVMYDKDGNLVTSSYRLIAG